MIIEHLQSLWYRLTRPQMYDYCQSCGLYAPIFDFTTDEVGAYHAEGSFCESCLALYMDGLIKKWGEYIDEKNP